MADQDDPQGQSRPTEPSDPKPALPSGRCHWCGYSLVGLADRGNCPECGKSYSPKTAARLQPWPSALKICVRLGWPIAGLIFAGFILATAGNNGEAWVLGLIIGCAMVGAVGFNSYLQVRSMLRRSLPEGIRTKGPVAIWRAIGTTICVIIILVSVGPFVFFIGCLMLLSQPVTH
ncbi:MAG: hypothetical protein IIA64_11530 [Planctomycetes bacterium]|nr:hypothetical protein [Planctomycetota bacterium]